MSLRGRPSERPPVRAGSPMVTSCSACGTGRVRSTSASMSVKVDVFAPMPSASVSSTTAVNPTFWRIVRSAYGYVLPQVAQIVGASHRAFPLIVDVEAAVANGVHVAEALERLCACGVGGESCADELLRAHGDVEVELLIDVALEVPAPTPMRKTRVQSPRSVTPCAETRLRAARATPTRRTAATPRGRCGAGRVPRR